MVWFKKIVFELICLIAITGMAFATAPTIAVTAPSDDANYLIGTQSIVFDVGDADGEVLDANIYISTSAGAHTYALATDLNLNQYGVNADLDCDSNVWTTPRTCHYVWDTRIILDGNYYIDVSIADNNSIEEDSSDNDFAITNGVTYWAGWTKLQDLQQKNFDVFWAEFLGAFGVLMLVLMAYQFGFKGR